MTNWLCFTNSWGKFQPYPSHISPGSINSHQQGHGVTASCHSPAGYRWDATSMDFLHSFVTTQMPKIPPLFIFLGPGGCFLLFMHKVHKFKKKLLNSLLMSKFCFLRGPIVQTLDSEIWGQVGNLHKHCTRFSCTRHLVRCDGPVHASTKNSNDKTSKWW